MRLVELLVSGIADEQAGVVEQGEVALGALLGSGANLDEGDAAANSLPSFPPTWVIASPAMDRTYCFISSFMFIASKKEAPPSLSAGGKGFIAES